MAATPLNREADGMPQPRRRRLPLCAALLGVVVLSAGCGSTVQLSSTRTVGSAGPGVTQTQDGTGLTGGTTSGGSAVPGGTTGAGSTTGAVLPGGSGGGISGTTGAGGSSTSGSGGATGTAVPATVPTTGFGWDAKHVYVGVITTNDTRQIYSSYGANNVDPGDTEAQAKAVAADLNRRGGILGRQVVLVFDDIKTIDTATNPSAKGQEVCSFFAQDHHVIAVWDLNTQIDQVPTLRTCLAHAKIPLFSVAARAITDPEMAALAPYYYQTIMVSWDALAPVLVARLKAQGYFTPWDTLQGKAGGSKPVKVGILVDGTAEGTHTGQVLTAAIKKAGYGDALVYQYAQASDGQSGSVQKFNGSGVTHVIVTDVELTAFQTAAATQRYRPRYGITSYNDPYSNLEASGLTPSGANNGAQGVGWAPNLDVSDSHDPGRTSGGKACDSTMAKGGQTFPNKRLAHLYASSLCDTFALLAQGAQRGQGFSGDALRRGIQALAPGFSPANGFGPALRAGSPYVQGVVRDLSWGTACSCFTYGRGTASLVR